MVECGRSSIDDMATTTKVNSKMLPVNFIGCIQ